VVQCCGNVGIGSQFILSLRLGYGSCVQRMEFFRPLGYSRLFLSLPASYDRLEKVVLRVLWWRSRYGELKSCAALVERIPMTE